MKDFDRPLEDRGVSDAANVGREMAARGWAPDCVICSTGRRARQTWEIAGAAGGRSNRTEERFLEKLYSTDAAGYVDVIREAGAPASLMLVGHNPMTEDLAVALAGKKDRLAENIRTSGFPTGGLAVIEFDTDARDVAPGTGRLVDFLRPKTLRKSD